MNIFVLDRDPVVAASYMCDEHIRKMAVESAQMLCVAVRDVYDWAPYALTHENHPSTKWVRTSRQNAEWLLAHLTAMLDEYERRRPIRRAHKVRADGLEAFFAWHIRKLPDAGLTPFAIVVKPQFLIPYDAVASYRKFYVEDKSRFATWRLGNIPAWYSEGVNHAS